MNDTKEKHATHTPGPWGYSEGEIYRGNNPIASVIPSFGWFRKTAEDEATARLIAAAPEMFEVLSELLDTLEMSKSYGFDEEYEKLREVLAKVEGGEG